MDAAGTPISYLPLELLVHILLFVVNDPADRMLRQTHTLSQVCKVWCSAILSSILFFTKLDPAQHKRTTQLVLRRNQRGPLDIYWDSRDTKLPEDRVTAFVEEVGVHATRWRSLHIWGDDTFKVSSLLLPRLHDITHSSLQFLRLDQLEWFYDHQGRRMEISFPRHNDTFPLSLLCLSGIGLPWHKTRIANLRYLHLSNLVASLVPSFPEFHNMLSASPNLEYLYLSHFGLDEATRTLKHPVASNLKALAPITLPHLKFMKLIVVLPRELLYALMAHIDAPNLRYYNSACSLRDHFQAHGESPFLSTVIPFISAATRLEMSYFCQQIMELLIDVDSESGTMSNTRDEWGLFKSYRSGLLLSMHTRNAESGWSDLVDLLRRYLPGTTECTLKVQDPEEWVRFYDDGDGSWQGSTPIPPNALMVLQSFLATRSSTSQRHIMSGVFCTSLL
ncbi:hypothetical protein FRB99_006547 [Tulasnella sp. 403]|nr:hypothetical protein FRB99_006547 [Tulasnella sp. 403]